MNPKLAFFLLFIGASSASFLDNVNTQVSAKKTVESVSTIFFPLHSRTAAVAVQQELLDDLQFTLDQIAADFEVGIVQADALEHLENLAKDIVTLEDDALLAEAKKIAEDMFDLLPGEAIDILTAAGIISPLGNDKVEKQDILGELAAILFQIIDELALTGTISEESIQALTDVIVEIETIIGEEWLNILAEFLGPILEFLPQELLDLLEGLGIVIPPKKAVTKQDILGELAAILFQIIDELALTGTISDASIQALTDVLVEIETIIGEEWLNILAEFLAPLLEFLPQELLDILEGLGIVIPSKQAVSKQDILGELAALLLQIVGELALTGTISDASLQALTDLLAEIQASIGADWLDILLQFLEPLLDLLPQELIDLLGELGIVIPTKHAVSKQDILGELAAILFQIIDELALTGTISDESIQALTDVLVEIETIIGEEWLNILAEFLAPLLEFLPQELLDILEGLGIVIPSKLAAGKQDILGELAALLLQIVGELALTGSISDASLQALTDLLAEIQASIGADWLDILLQFLEPLLDLLPQELIDLLGELGIVIPGKHAVTKQDILGELAAILFQIIDELALTGTISEESIQALTDVLVEIETIIGEEWLNILAEFLGPLLEFLPQELLDILEGLGIVIPSKLAAVSKQDILGELAALLLQIVGELALTGTISDASLQALTDLLAEIQASIGADWLDILLQFLEPLLAFLPQELIDLLGELGIVIPTKHAITKQDILGELVALLLQIIDELAATGTISEASIQALTDIIVEVEIAIGEGWLNILADFLAPLLDLLPQELLDLLEGLGIVIPSKLAAVSRQDILGELAALLLQIVGELALTGTISDASLQALTDLLAEIQASIGADWLDILLQFLEPLLGLLPQELIDLLGELGIVIPTKHVSVKQDILWELATLLFDIVDELALTGQVSEESLQALTDVLQQIEDILGADWLAVLLNFLEPLLAFLPQEILDILGDFGIVIPPKEVRVAKITKVLSVVTLRQNKDIWQDLVDALIIQLVEILADLDAWGVTIGDDLLAQIESFILAVLAEGGQAWVTLQQMLEQYAEELQGLLGDLLNEIGITP